MVSILIPVYNQEVCQLVKDLVLQVEEYDQNIEIRVYDDGSHENFKKTNRIIQSLSHVIYKERPLNVGRAAIRNLLAAESSETEYLLFLDGDSKIIHKNFIKTYLDAKTKNTVIYGGRLYQANKPEKNKVLHWKYGRTTESRKSSTRNKDPYLHFQSNNFLIPTSVFMDNVFDESLKTYGYEDLVLGQGFKEKGIPILHIDNEILHDGIEINEVYLKKTKEAIRNLAELYKNAKISQSKLIDTSKKLHRYRVSGVLHLWLKILRKNLIKNLMSDEPSVFIFQLYKLLLWWDETKKASI
jgi:hypothetical protein